ncbi:MAG: hypothetical protein ACLFUS_08350 [Candidatus Sumerlaeia bacterium]
MTEKEQEHGKLTRTLAKHCSRCPVCSHARKKQKGLAYWMVKNVESHVCPACRSYEKVYGRKAYEPVPENAQNIDGQKQ